MKNTVSRRSVLAGTMGAVALVGTPAVLSGCGSGSETPTNAGNAKLPTYMPYQGAKPDMPGERGRASDLYFSYPADPVTAVSEVPGDGKPITALTLAEVAPPALDRNSFWQEFNKRMGSPYEPALSPAADYAAKFATVTAGDQLPDFFTVLPGTPSTPQLLQARAVDLSEHLSGDAVKDYPFLANIPTESWRGTVFNGRILALPIARGFSSSWAMYKRSDLLRAKGVTQDPTSFQEFFDLCSELTDPKQNKWALASVPLLYIRQMLGIPNTWKEEGGKFTSSYEVDEQEQALEAARKINEAGLINPDAPAVHDSQQKKWFLNGSAVFGWFTLSAWPTLATDGGEVEGYEGDGLAVPGFESGHGTPHLGNPNHSIVGIGKKNEGRIKTILAIANWLAAPFGTKEWLFKGSGIEGKHYNFQDGVPKIIKETASERGLGQGYLSSPPGVLFSADRPMVTRQQAYERVFTENAVANPAVSLYSATQARSGATLETNIKAIELDIVLGRKPVSAWRDAVKDYLSKGGTEIKNELAEAFANS